MSVFSDLGGSFGGFLRLRGLQETCLGHLGGFLLVSGCFCCALGDSWCDLWVSRGAVGLFFAGFGGSFGSFWVARVFVCLVVVL